MSGIKKIVVGSDHAGFEMKEHVKKYLEEKGIEFEDVSAQQYDAQDDYTTYAFKVAEGVSKGNYERGILLCGTGIGASIAANRFRGIRAALCTSPEMARMSRLHNDSNVLVMGGRTTPADVVDKMIDAWLSSNFEGGRHQRRIQQMDTAPII
jgi:ribose 5-phosphate isomerase B